MCGIVGLINFCDFVVDPDVIWAATNTLYERGPDDSGIWTENNAGLGHRRLAILDLTSAGHQPMLSQDKRYVIVFNGEIYNFLALRRQFGRGDEDWQSHSDTEVILAAYAKWGVQCVTRFQGMFAFAIWDRQEKVLFAARDRMGVKPFYFHHSSDCFAFASRPHALFSMNLNLSREVDEQALRLYLESGYVPAPHSIHRTIRKLPPAHYLLMDKNGLNINRYWDFRQITPDRSWEKRHEIPITVDIQPVFIHQQIMCGW